MFWHLLNVTFFKLLSIFSSKILSAPVAVQFIYMCEIVWSPGLCLKKREKKLISFADCLEGAFNTQKRKIPLFLSLSLTDLLSSTSLVTFVINIPLMVQTQAETGNSSVICGRLFKRASQFKKSFQKQESTEKTRISFLFCSAVFEG